MAIWIARTVGRPLLERWFGVAELARWERKLRLRSPLVWYLLFLFPVPDVVIPTPAALQDAGGGAAAAPV